MIADAHIDSDALPLALQNLFDQFAGAVARRRHDFQPQWFAFFVVAHALARVLPSGLDQKLNRLFFVMGVVGDVVGIDPVQGADAGMGHRLASGE